MLPDRRTAGKGASCDGRGKAKQAKTANIVYYGDAGRWRQTHANGNDKPVGSLAWP
jgi:hypothetical protein